jgi:predicted DsbA family dithiol-disulfide isomerase
MTTFHITAIADSLCPWSYINYRRLERGINTYKQTYPGAANDTFAITWKPFFLQRDSPDLGPSHEGETWNDSYPLFMPLS